MKKSILLICLAFSFAANAQQKSTTAVVKDNILKDYHAPDFTYYAKNYEELFGSYRYTFDVNPNKYGIFVLPNSFFYSLDDGRKLPIMVMADNNTSLYYNFNGGNIISGVLSALTGESITAGYTLPRKK